MDRRNTLGSENRATSLEDEAKTTDLMHRSQKALMWERWQQGESLSAISRLFDRYHPSIQGILARTGEIGPAPRGG